MSPRPTYNCIENRIVISNKPTILIKGPYMNLKTRSLLLLQNTRFLTLATQGNDQLPWASTVEHCVKLNPLRFIWFSSRQAKHSKNIQQNEKISGSLFNHSLPEMLKSGLDGMQFTGKARELTDAECEEALEEFYPQSPFDEISPSFTQVNLNALRSNGHSRFYEMTVDHLWMFDIKSWGDKQESRRVTVPISLLSNK